MTTENATTTTTTGTSATTGTATATAADWVALQKRAQQEFGHRVAAIDDWATPVGSGPSVDTLVRCVVRKQQWVPALLAGVTPTATRHRVDPLSDDLTAEWRTHSARATVAWQAAAADAPDALVQLSDGSITVLDYLREQVVEMTIHSWDLARAIGAEERLDDALITAVWSVFEPWQATLEASALVVVPTPLPADTPLQSRLLALVGRDDRR